MAPLNIPPELKKITQFVRRAEELDQDTTRPESRLVAYYCRQQAVSVGIPFSNTPAAKKCLAALLGELEAEKPAMSNFSREEAEYLVRKFANMVFDRADQEDRNGKANKDTARVFYVAATLFETLQQFYPKPPVGADDGSEDHLSEEQQEDCKKRKYSKWKATDILKAIKEGRNVVPGAFGEMDAVHQQMDAIHIQPDDTDDIAPTAPTGGLALRSSSFDIPIAPRASYQYNQIELPPPMPIYTASGPDEQGEETILVDHPPPSVSPQRSNVSSRRSSAASPTFSERPHVPTRSPSPPTSPPRLSTLTSMSSVVSSVVTKIGGERQIVQPRQGKVSKDDIADALELTRFALVALEAKDAELGAQRLEEALGCLGKR